MVMVPSSSDGADLIPTDSSPINEFIIAGSMTSSTSWEHIEQEHAAKQEPSMEPHGATPINSNWEQPSAKPFGPPLRSTGSHSDLDLASGVDTSSRDNSATSEHLVTA